MTTRIVYFDENRVALVRLILVVAGAEFEERKTTRKEWMDMKPSKYIQPKRVRYCISKFDLDQF